MKKQIKNYIEKYDKKITIAALLTVPVFFLETYASLPYVLYITFEAFSWTIWAVLALQIFLKWYAINSLTTKEFVKENAIDLVVMILPFIRALELVKVLKLSKLIQQLETAIAAKDMKKIISLRKLFNA